MGPRDLANVEPGEHCVREVDEPDAEPVAARGRHPLGESRGRQRSELRETVLGVIPVRRAISFVPSSPASASVSSTAIALSAAPIRRVEG